MRDGRWKKKRKTKNKQKQMLKNVFVLQIPAAAGIAGAGKAATVCLTGIPTVNSLT